MANESFAADDGPNWMLTMSPPARLNPANTPQPVTAGNVWPQFAAVSCADVPTKLSSSTRPAPKAEIVWSQSGAVSEKKPPTWVTGDENVATIGVIVGNTAPPLVEPVNTPV